MQNCYKSRYYFHQTFLELTSFIKVNKSRYLTIFTGIRNQLTAITLILISSSSYGQAIFSNTITGVNPSSSNPYTTGQVVHPNITTDGVRRGSGNGVSNSTNSYSLIRWNQSAITPAKCIQFKMVPNACFEIDFTSFQYSGALSSGSANFVLRSSADNFNSNIGLATASGGTISLSGSSFQNITSEITFRLYIWGSASNSVVYSLYDFSFNGTVSSGGGPNITTQPVSSATYCQNTSPSPLTIAASTSSGSISGYQWFVNTSFSNVGGTPISGANWLSYYPPGSTPGVRFYYCVATSSLGCSVTSNAGRVIITAQPSGNFSYSAYGYCNSVTELQAIASSNFAGSAGTFSAPSGLSINSITGEVNPGISTPRTSPYIVTYSVPAANGCNAFSSTTSVTIEQEGTGTFSYPSSTLCKSVPGTVSPVVVGASGSGNSTWFLGSPSGMAINGSGVINASSSNAGTYTVTYYRAASGTCPTYSTSIPITIVNGGEAVNAGSNFTKSCTSFPNGKVIGESNDGSTYSWSPTTGLSSSTVSNPTANPSTTTTYTVTKGSGNCASTASVIVTVNNSAPAANAGSDFTKSCSSNANGAQIGVSPVSGVTYLWSPTTGLSASTIANPIANPLSTTTYTLTATNTSSGCTATDVVTVTVSYSLPTVGSTSPSSRCGSGTVVLGATSAAGTINWYSSASGGSSVGSGNSFTTPSISSTTTYFAEAASGSCVSASRTAVVATVNSYPTISEVDADSRCGPGTVTLEAESNSGTISWFAASGGGSSLGTGELFTTPSISSTTTYYVEVTNNGCTSLSRTPVVATVNLAPTITSTIPGNRCGSGTVTLSAAASSGTLSWHSASSGGSLLGSGLTFITPSITATTTYFVGASANGCPSSVRTAVVASVNSIPTITASSAGNRCGEGTVSLGASSSAGTINWYTSSSGGTSIESGTPFITPSISTTTTYYAESSNGFCVSNSRTAVVATVNTIPTIASSSPGSRCGNGSVSLGATATAGTLTWFAASSGGSSLGSGTTFNTPSISTNTSYFVQATSSGCISPERTAVLATVNSIPTITAITPSNRCGAGTVTLGATASDGTVNWFTTLTGGSAIATGASFTTPSISVNTTYYVNATSNGCTTASRTAILATVFTIPAVSSSVSASRCGEGTVNLTAVASSGTLNWYAAPTGGALLGTGSPFTTPSNSATTIYYVDAIANSCTSTPRTAVNATVNTQPTITSVIVASRCGNGTLSLSATASEGTVRWYSAATGGSLLLNGSAYTTPSISSTSTYYAEAISGGCASNSRSAVVATVNANPTIVSQVTLAATYVQNASANSLSVIANAGSGTIDSYQWYLNTVASNAGGTAIDGANTASYTPLTTTSGNSWYYCLVTNSNGCFVKSTISGAILINALPTITSVIPTLPLITEQENNTGFRGQRITINGTNFMSNATVNYNGTAGTGVIFVNSGTLTALVNNVGPNSEGVVTVTNPTTTASANAPFSYIGYITNATGDWNSTACWLGTSIPTTGSDASVAYANTCNAAVVSVPRILTVRAGGVLTFGTVNSALTVENVTNKGSMIWTNSGSLRIGADFNLTETSIFTPGAGRVIFNKDGDQLLFSGRSTVSFNILSITGLGQKTLGMNTVLEVKNLNVATDASFNVGTTNQDVRISGDLVLEGNMDPGTSKIRFTGLVDQTISVAGEGIALFSDLYVNKLSGTLKLNNNIQVRDTLRMVVGNINTQGKLMELGTGITNPGVLDYINGYVMGRFRRWYEPKTNSIVSTGLFPMGQKVDNTWYDRAMSLYYTLAPTVGGHLTVEFMPVPMINGAIGTQTFIDPINTGGTSFTVSNFSSEGYWKVDNQIGALTDGKYTISLTGEGFISLENSMTQITMVKRVNGGNWFCPGTHLPLLGDALRPTLRRSNVTGFSNFGYAGSVNEPLPITLISFEAVCNDSKLIVTWTTAAETNNKEFHIQESKDAINWANVATIAGAGNSTTIRDYSHEVESSYSGGSYFRMTQVDFNGDSETFDPIFVTCGKKTKSEVKIYPNPAIDYVNVEITSSNEMEIGMALFNTSGQILLSQKVRLQEGSNLIRLDLSSIPPGSYHINLSNTQNIEITGGRSIIKR